MAACKGADPGHWPLTTYYSTGCFSPFTLSVHPSQTQACHDRLGIFCPWTHTPRGHGASRVSTWDRKHEPPLSQFFSYMKACTFHGIRHHPSQCLASRSRFTSLAETTLVTDASSSGRTKSLSFSSLRLPRCPHARHVRRYVCGKVVQYVMLTWTAGPRFRFAVTDVPSLCSTGARTATASV